MGWVCGSIPNVLTGMIFNIQRFSTHDGPGIRTTLFFKGCPLDCWWCHNPESKSSLPQIAARAERCIRCGACGDACPQHLSGPCRRCGECAAACPTGAREVAGRAISVEEAMREILKDRVFHERSGNALARSSPGDSPRSSNTSAERGGVTFSGGEPLLQSDFLCALLQSCRDQEVHTALDTCGYAPTEHLLRAASLASLILYDLKLIDDDKHRQFTGVSNQRILENLRVLSRHHTNTWIRIPVIPGINDTDADLEALAEVSATAGGVQRICLLPYHATGVGKLARFGDPLEDRLGDVTAPTPDRMEQIAERFRLRCGSGGKLVHIGG